ncbi:MAG: hypothetical protein ACTSX6_03485 [Candidatus Heimdallarchaeaceae archaeon]
MNSSTNEEFIKIRIKRDKHEYFSKGILSSSLYSVGMDANQAMEVANQVETSILNSSKIVTKNKLIKIITEEIAKTNKEFSERYKVHEGKGKYKPIIILLSGVPGIGKSTLASMLSQRLEITKIIGTDIIREILRQTISSKLVPEIHCSSYEAYKCIKPTLNPILRQSIVGYEEQSRHIVVGVEATIQSALYSRENTLIEGVHLAPNIIKPSVLQNPHVTMIMLYLEDKEEHMKRIQSRGTNVKNRGAQRYIEAFSEIRNIQTYLVEEATKAGIPIVETSDRVTALKKIMDIIWKKILSLEKSNIEE